MAAMGKGEGGGGGTAPKLILPSLLLYIHRDHKDYWGQGAQGIRLDFHAAPERWGCCSSSRLLYIHRDHKDYWGQGAQGIRLDFHAAPEL